MVTFYSESYVYNRDVTIGSKETFHIVVTTAIALVVITGVSTPSITQPPVSHFAQKSIKSYSSSLITIYIGIHVTV